ncbi:MAG: UPF0175 family protein [Bacteroidota bacterium]
MSILITEDILRSANMSAQEFKLELGIYLYTKNILTLGKASEFVGLPKIIFQKEISKRDIPVSYDQEEFDKDIMTINKNYPSH